jgi:serine/threonine protein kinase/Tfp pilus assembly protein PilF
MLNGSGGSARLTHSGSVILMIGQTVSHYRITGKLGEGGMGVVYSAEDTKLQRPVALKFVSGGPTADPRARERLLQEARAASRLNHPNIATIYEVGEVDGSPFIAMEEVRGESLKHALLRGALPPAKLQEVASQMAEALNEAHRAGVLHRDIKPGNVMLDSKERVKILDFGLASFATREEGEAEESFITRSTKQHTAGGTVPYMSPEQLRGETADARSDVFSMGVMLYECLTGRLPFQGETAIDTLHAILRQPYVPLRRMVPDISEGWERFFEKCLAKAPEQRFSSMESLLEALPQEEAPSTEPEKSLAVLYLENLSRSEEEEYFRDGITEDIIIELSKIRGLHVFPRSAALAYRDKPATAPEIGRALNASHVLGGSLRRAGNRLRITAQLVETRTGHSVWAERYDRQLEDVFAIQDEIAQNIARALQVMLTEQEKRAIQRAPTADVQAYDFYLRGRQLFYQFRRKGLESARQMFARAIGIDSGYARAYAGVADCWSFLYMYHGTSEGDLKEAEAASKKAVELDPESAEAHASRGVAVSLRRQYELAAEEFETAIRLNPKLFEAYYFYARARFAEGKLEEAARLFERACRVSPEDFQAPILLAQVYRSLGREEDTHAAYQRALEVIEKNLRLHPDDPRALYFGAVSLCTMGERERGLDYARRALALDPDDPTVLYNVACVYSQAGLINEAIDCLEKSIALNWRQKDWIENDSDLDPIRDHPRFRALLERL